MCDQYPYTSLHAPYGSIVGISGNKKPVVAQHCPFRIEAMAGQHIEINIIDFNPSNELQTCIPLG